MRRGNPQKRWLTLMPLADFLRRNKIQLLLWAVVALFYARFIRHPEGMKLFPFAANCLLQGEKMNTCAPLFTYPPAFAFFMIPFAPLPMWTRNLLWYAALVGATWLSFRLCERLTRMAFPGPWQQRDLTTMRFLALALSLKFILSVFENQAYDGIVFLFLLVGLEGMASGKDLRASIGFGVAAALKATPLLFFPYLLLRGRVKLFLACVAVYLGISFLPDLFFTPKGAPPGYFGTWLNDIAGGALKSTVESKDMWFEGPGVLNQSLRSLVFRLSTELGYTAHFHTILAAVYIGYLFLTFALLLGSARIVNPYLLDGSLLVVGMLMLSPMSSKSHFVALMLPYMALSAYVIREQRMRWIGGGVLAVSFALNSLMSKGLLGRDLGNIALSAGSVTIGTLVLLIFLGYIIYVDGKRIRTEGKYAS